MPTSWNWLCTTARSPASGSTATASSIQTPWRAAAAAEGELKKAVLYWDETEVEFHDAAEDAYYTTVPPNNEFGAMLQRSFNQQRIAYNVYVEFHTESGVTKRQRMVYSGEPSDHAVSASQLVAIMDNDHLIEADGSVNWQQEVDDDDSRLYIPDSKPSTGYFNLVKVEVVAWRI